MSLPFVAAAGKLFSSPVVAFALGAATGPTLARLAAPVGGATRTLLKTALKGGYVAGRSLQSVVAEAKAGLNDIKAEAQADLARPAEGSAVEVPPAAADKA